MNDADFQNCLRELDSTSNAAALPATDAIWWRAEIRRRMAAEERATRPLRVADWLACAACLLAAAVIAAVR